MPRLKVALYTGMYYLGEELEVGKLMQAKMVRGWEGEEGRGWGGVEDIEDMEEGWGGEKRRSGL